MVLLVLGLVPLRAAARGHRNTIHSGRQATPLGWTVDGRFLVVETKVWAVFIKEESTRRSDHRAREAREHGYCLDYTAHVVEVLDARTGRRSQGYLRSFTKTKGSSCSAPPAYANLPDMKAFAQWRKSHPLQLHEGPRAPGRRARVEAKFPRRLVQGSWRQRRFMHRLGRAAYKGAADGPPDSQEATFALVRADGTRRDKLLPVDVHGEWGAVHAVWSPDGKRLALVSNGAQDTSHCSYQRMSHSLDIVIFPVAGPAVSVCAGPPPDSMARAKVASPPAGEGQGRAGTAKAQARAVAERARVAAEQAGLVPVSDHCPLELFGHGPGIYATPQAMAAATRLATLVSPPLPVRAHPEQNPDHEVCVLVVKLPPRKSRGLDIGDL